MFPELRVLTRSPPPQLNSAAIILSLRSRSTPLKTLQSKAKLPHKPVASDVAFYRDMRASSSSSNSLASVKFTVSSELDDANTKERSNKAGSVGQQEQEDGLQTRVIQNNNSISEDEATSNSLRLVGSAQSSSETILSVKVEKRGVEENVSFVAFLGYTCYLLDTD